MNAAPSPGCRNIFLRAAFYLALTACALAENDSGATEQTQASAPGVSGLSLEQLMDVQVTTVAREESTAGESPAAVFVITQEMIHRSGATTIAELLRMVPGMDVARVNGHTWDISARGFNNSIAGKMLVQIDGRTLYTPVYSIVYWDTVDYPLEDIERIEVIRGPGGSVWGANAVNGIINIITKSAKDTQGGLASVGGGTSPQSFGEFRFGGKLSDNLYYRAYGKWSDFPDEFNALASSHDRWYEGRLGMRIDWTPNTEDSFTLQGDWFDSVADQETFVAQPAPPFSMPYFHPEITDGANVLGRWKRSLGKDSNLEVQAYWDRFDQDLGREARFVINTYDLDFHHEFPLGSRQKIVYGAGYRLTEFSFRSSIGDNGFALNGSPDSRNSQLFSAFIQDQITIIPERFSLTVGSKFEHNDFTGFEAQPTGRILWTPTKRQTVWFSVSRAVRTPGFIEDSVQITTPPASPAAPVFPQLVGNTGLASEKVVAYELGYRAAVTDKLSLDIASFYNVYDDLTVFVPGKISTLQGLPVLPRYPANRMTGDTYGVEVSTTWQAEPWWQLYGSYSYLKMEMTGQTGGLGAVGRSLVTEQVVATENGSPQNMVYIRSSWDLPAHFQFDLIGRYVDWLLLTPNVPGYITLDARLAWKPCKNIELSVVGQNLLDNHHPEVSAASPVEIERSVFAKAAYFW